MESCPYDRRGPRQPCAVLSRGTWRACRGALETQAHRLSTAGTAQRTRDVYYQSHAFPRQTNHQHKDPTSPPTTAITATEMPAMAPEERLGPLLLAAPPITRWQRTGPLAAQVTQPLTPVTSPLLDSQDAHVLPERSVQRDGAQTRCTVPQVETTKKHPSGSQSGTARCGGGSGDRRPPRQSQTAVWGLSQAVHR